jgi:hypothetical protein
MDPGRIGAALTLLVAFGMSAGAQASYCVKSALGPESGTSTLAHPADLVELLAARCRPGDIILLDSHAIGLIGRACDFTQAIVPLQTPLGPRIMCVMVIPREMENRP